MEKTSEDLRLACDENEENKWIFSKVKKVVWVDNNPLIEDRTKASRNRLIALIADSTEKYMPPSASSIEKKVNEHIAELEKKEKAMEQLAIAMEENKNNATEIAKLQKQKADAEAETARIRAKAAEDMQALVRNNAQDPQRQQVMKEYGIFEGLLGKVGNFLDNVIQKSCTMM